MGAEDEVIRSGVEGLVAETLPPPALDQDDDPDDGEDPDDGDEGESPEEGEGA